MEKKKLKLTISGSSKKTINNIELAKSHGKNSVVIEKKNTRFGSKSSFSSFFACISAYFLLPSSLRCFASSSSFLAASSFAFLANTASADTFIRMVSGPSGGSWYPLGAKIMQTFQSKIKGCVASQIRNIASVFVFCCVSTQQNLLKESQ